jgi:hypothetical protein
MRNYSQKLTAGIFYTGFLEYQALRMLRGRYHVRLVGCTFPNLILLPLPAIVTSVYNQRIRIGHRAATSRLQQSV